ncbi:MAG: glycosyltransferase family 4 protein, partial [Pseudomonadota bacterium]
RIMGRQAAGHAFLRAAVAGRQGQTVHAYTPYRRSAEAFAQLVAELDPSATAAWVPADRLDLLARIGTLYLPGPGLDDAARLRLRAGAAAYSLAGVTHTTASHGAMDAIAGLLSAPVMPWDALICTSTAVAGTVKVLLEAELEYLRWRFGNTLAVTLPQLPIIPLGVHCGDFVFPPAERSAARAALGIGEDEVVALFVGRLSFHAKAHPHAMYAALEAAAARTGKKIVLLQCGWFANEAIERSFGEGARQFCPAVRALFLDGKEAGHRRQSWGAADLFISLSDNIQETFGLTPIEAMAAGLPVVVTDWNGYKDTVRDGVDGFRIPTWMPPPNLGEGFARAHEAGVENYDFYCGLSCQTVAVDGQVLAERLSDLAANPDLRRSMGEAGRQRAWAEYEWAVVYRRYQALYGQLAEIRRSAPDSPDWRNRLAAAPRAAASRLDPYQSFARYPTAQIQPGTLVSAASGASRKAYEQLREHGLFAYAVKILPAPEVVERLLASLGQGARTVQLLAEGAGVEVGVAVLAVAVLAKMGLVRLSAEAALAPE